MAGACVLTSWNCATSSDDEGRARGRFTPEQLSEIDRGPAGFASIERDGRELLVTSTVVDRVARRHAAGRAPDAASVDARDDLRLEAEFLGDYAAGMRVAIAARPRAYVDAVPVSARPARGALRGDGSLVEFANAFEGVSAVFSATTER